MSRNVCSTGSGPQPQPQGPAEVLADESQGRTQIPNGSSPCRRAFADINIASYMNLRFNIYLRRFGKLAKLYKFHRNASGLYVWSRQSKDYISYHEDGRYWIRRLGNKTVKKIRRWLDRAHANNEPANRRYGISGKSTGRDIPRKVPARKGVLGCIVAKLIG